MTIEKAQYTANAHTTGCRDSTSHRDLGRRDGQVSSLGIRGMRAFLMTAASSRAVHMVFSPSPPTP